MAGAVIDGDCGTGGGSINPRPIDHSGMLEGPWAVGTPVFLACVIQFACTITVEVPSCCGRLYTKKVRPLAYLQGS